MMRVVAAVELFAATTLAHQLQVFEEKVSRTLSCGGDKWFSKNFSRTLRVAADRWLDLAARVSDQLAVTARWAETGRMTATTWMRVISSFSSRRLLSDKA